MSALFKSFLPFGKYDPNQERYPAGHPKGGQWRGDDEGGAEEEEEEEELHQTAINALGEDDAKGLWSLLQDPDADPDEILDALEAANAKFNEIAETLDPDAIPEDFFETRVYVDGMNINQVVDRLEAKALEYAGENGAQENGEVWFVMGAPASGKSTTAEYIARRDGFAIVDSDDAKELIPEFNGGLGAGAVHEESTIIAERVRERLTQRGVNVLVPTVGHNRTSLQQRIDYYEGRGYQPRVINLEVSRANATRRMARRFMRKGRLIPTTYFRGVVFSGGEHRPNRVFEEISTENRYRTARIDGDGAFLAETIRSSQISQLRVGSLRGQ